MKPLDYFQTAVASRDIQGILDTFASENARAASRFADAMERTVELMRRQPLIGERLRHPRKEGVRRLLVDRFHNYAIYYDVHDNVLEIIRVLHNAREIDDLIDET